MIKKEYPPEFERLMDVHPTRSSKGSAFKAFKALKITPEDIDGLIVKIKRYARLCEIEQREKRYIKSLGPWLNNCIDDDIELPETPEEKQRREWEKVQAIRKSHGVN